MDREDLARRLMATFLGELDEHVRALNRDLLALEKDPGDRRAELLKSLYRTAHSLKGAARSVNVDVIEAACHRLEEILGGARDGTCPLDPTLVQLIFTAADGLEEAGRRLRDKQDAAGSALEALLPGLDAAARAGLPVAVPPAAAPAPAASSAGGKPPDDEGYVRVPVEKLDALLAGSGELLVARRRVAKRHEDMVGLLGAAHDSLTMWQRLETTLRSLAVPSGRGAGADRSGRRRGSTILVAPTGGALPPLGRMGDDLKRMGRALESLLGGLQGDQRDLDKAAGPLEEGIRRARMLPFAEACEGLERGVRDLSRAAGKEVDVAIEGGDVELDRSILQGLRDPLLHLVRNAVDHGVEPPVERQALGKPRRARITVAAVLKGTRVEITVEDDGRGLDLAAIAERARHKRMPVAEDPAELARLLFLPGFSTVPLVTEVSGRGVGLDVVKNGVDGLHGSVDVSSEPGRGVRFVLAVPLTLTTIRVLLVGCAGEVFALPSAGVHRLLRAGPAELDSVEGREVVRTEDAPLPAVSLAEVLGIPATEAAPPGARAPFVVLSDGEHDAAFAVGELIVEQEVVVKSLGRRLRRVRNVTGATVLPTGRVALILSPAGLVREALGRAPGRALPPAPDEGAEAPRRRLLVVDDSVTTRSLERSILEAAGYEVTVAIDGAEAWRTLQEQGSDLVVADIEMPRMDGFALAEAIRGSTRFRDLPVVLVTARESDQDRARGLEVGADAYLPKSTFDQTVLLQTIAQLL
jgi:two-component system chemotaxis sensor kinase CheA